LLFILLAALVGFAVYWVVSAYAPRQLSFLPNPQAQTLQANLSTLEAQQAGLGTQQAGMASRLATAEAEKNSSLQGFSEVQTRQDSMDNQLQQQAAALTALASAQPAQAAALGTPMAALSTQASAQEGALRSLDLQTRVFTAMERLDRARVSLVYNNLSAASEQLLATRDLLGSGPFASQSPAAALAHVNQAIADLGQTPPTPVLALGELDLAWDELLRISQSLSATAGVPSTVTPPKATPPFPATPGSSPTPTATPTPSG
jgi:hypothetical protein